MRLRHKGILSLLGLLELAALSPVHVQAQVTAAPSLMNFQGRLATPSGNPVPDGTYSIRFSLWNVASGGTAGTNEKWNQTIANVQVKNGTFAVLLSGFSATAFDGNLWLETKIGTDTPLTPRQQLVSVAYAMKANSVPDGSIGANQLANGSITANKFANDALGWLLGGNPITDPVTQFLGTTSNQPLVFKTNNAERMRLLAGGNLGIGTLMPVTRVDIRGGENPVGTPAFIVGGQSGTQGQRAIAGLYSTFVNVPADTNARRTADIAAGFNGGAWGTEYLSFNVGNNGTANDAAALTSEKVRITSNGNVGIGTAAPTAKLEVAGTVQMTGFKLPTGAGANKVLTSDAAGAGTWNVLTSLLENDSVTSAMIQSVDWSKITNIPGGLGGNSNVVSGASAVIPGGSQNTASQQSATVGGGYSNTSNGAYSTVGGGQSNTAYGSKSTVAGGYFNWAGKLHDTIGGGQNNTTIGTAATIGGGYQNNVSGPYATVGGGQNNTVYGASATVPGGSSNTATGAISFAAGNRAKANHHGAFVWADSTDADFVSTVTNEFNVRASGGTRIFSNSAATTGVLLAAGGGSWSSASDRNIKTNFRNVDTLDVLEKLAAMPITSWNYKANTNIRHLGVMAQDFFAAFGGLGMDDKHIDTVDADGVAFAAIQGLNRKLDIKVKGLQAEVVGLKTENAELKARLEALETAVQRLTAQPK